MTKLKAQKTDRSMSLVSAMWGAFTDKKKKALSRQNVSIFTM